MNAVSINNRTFEITDLAKAKQQVFRWAQQEDTVGYLDSNAYGQQLYGEFEGMVAVGKVAELSIEVGSGQDAFKALRDFHKTHQDWLFGYLSYDLKNHLETLTSENTDGLGWPELHFFKPKHLIWIFKNSINIKSETILPHQVWADIQRAEIVLPVNHSIGLDRLKSRISKSDYLDAIRQIKHHLHIGDIYEMNFCQEFFIDNIDLHPASLFKKLNQIGKAPFSCFYKNDDQYLLSASPERFLKKTGNTLISQPIKGTIKRAKDKQQNQALIQTLLNSKKDRTENVMIVDLVRNDLSRTCIPGTVKVKELFGAYPFEQVNHLVSTITGQLRPSLDFVDAIKNAFPMGSMTGAPKIRSMELIEQYEQTKRGLYAGAVGYITPDGDFDFNVVIRSMMYDAQRRYLSFQVGGAIVNDSVAEQEYQECLLKAKGILTTLSS